MDIDLFYRVRWLINPSSTWTSAARRYTLFCQQGGKRSMVR